MTRRRSGDRFAPVLALLLLGAAARAADEAGLPARITLASGETLAVRFLGATEDGGLRYARGGGGEGETFWEEVTWLRLGDDLADPAPLRILLRDGSVLAAHGVESEGDGGAVRVEEPDLGELRLPAEALVWIRSAEGPMPHRPKGGGPAAALLVPASPTAPPVARGPGGPAVPPPPFHPASAGAVGPPRQVRASGGEIPRLRGDRATLGGAEGRFADGAVVFYPPSPPVPRARATAFWARLRGGSALRTAAPRDARSGVAQVRTPLLGLREVPWPRVREVRAVPPRSADRVLVVEFSRGLVREFGPTREPEWTYGGPDPLLDAETLPEGGLLLADRAAGRVIEVSALGDEVWTVAARDPISATRLPDGNTLITSFLDSERPEPRGAVTEVSPAGETVWSLLRLDCPTEADPLPEGHLLVCETGLESGDPARRRVTVRGRDGSELARWGGFRYPADAERLPGGGVVVADRDDGRVVFLDREGSVVRTIGGPGGRVPLAGPYDVDLLPDGSVLIADMARGPAMPGRVLRVGPDDRVLWSLTGLADPIEVEAR